MGAWFTPPVDYDEMAERIGLNDEYEEYAIHDYELPFEIDEYTPIEEVNRLCEMVEDLPEDIQDELIITADTVVCINEKVLGKPRTLEEAKEMLRELSGKTHQVITGVCLMTRGLQRTFSATTQVTFDVLTEDEIEFYVEKFRPLDKAGAYGVQEWIGFVGVSRLEGSYFNVMGLPVQRLYQELKKL